MKQLETTQKVIGENTFYIRPFPAFVAAGLSADLAALISPLIGGLASLVVNDAENVMDMDAEKALPAVSEAFASLSGDKVESLITRLLVKYDNISVQGPDTGNEAKRMNMDLANEVFCGEVQDMYLLCFEVIRLNFKGFFKKLGDRFGNLQGILEKMSPSTANTES